MRHPNAFPDETNPREVRAFLHTAYDRYVHAEDMFPKVRVTDLNLLPRKSFAIAAALTREWDVIDEDRRYFDTSLNIALLAMQRSNEPQQGQVIAKVGRNAVNFAVLETPGGNLPGRIALGTQNVKSIVADLEANPLQLTDGRQLEYLGGVLQEDPKPNMVVTRMSGRSSVFFT